jgi:V/A-type H+-transporting ATPase subunit E
LTTEEKLQHFYDYSMESAQNEAKSMLDEYSIALNKIFKEHQENINQQAEIRLHDETNAARREFNKALSAEQLVIKRTLSKKTNEIKEQLFTEVQQKLMDFKNTPEYMPYLCRKMKEAWDFAAGDEMVIYIDPSDSHLAEKLGEETGVVPTISKEIFLGGMRAVISSKNILIDNSFTSLLREEKEQFNFDGGMVHE